MYLGNLINNVGDKIENIIWNGLSNSIEGLLSKIEKDDTVTKIKGEEITEDNINEILKTIYSNVIKKEGDEFRFMVSRDVQRKYKGTDFELTANNNIPKNTILLYDLIKFGFKTNISSNKNVFEIIETENTYQNTVSFGMDLIINPYNLPSQAVLYTTK